MGMVFGVLSLLFLGLSIAFYAVDHTAESAWWLAASVGLSQYNS